MRDTMILIPKLMKDKQLNKLNKELIVFGGTRGLWCSEGTMMIPTDENIRKLIEQMKKLKIKTILTETKQDLLSRLDRNTLNEKLKENGISCLCRQENIIFGIPDDSLLMKHKQHALLVYENEKDIPAMKEYIDSKGIVMQEALYESELNEQQQKELLEKILAQDIDMVVMPEFDYFNGEDYTTPLLFALLEHGIHVHIAEDGVDISEALNQYFAQEQEQKLEQGQALMC